MRDIERTTGELFGSLWHRLTDEQYQDSVDLFRQRFSANGFDLDWFKGKRCLDAGTGSGRYALAMAMHGAGVSACDVSPTGLETAREWTRAIAPIDFKLASVLNLPYPDSSFDFVCCAGVLHHTTSIEKGLDQLTRVLKPGGKLFLLLYGAGGLRWKLIAALRPLAQELGYNVVDKAIAAAGLPANNRKHFLDDLFVEIQTLVKWDELSDWLSTRGYTDVRRWTKGQFDHEASPAEQLKDMHKLTAIFDQIDHPLGRIGHLTAESFCHVAEEELHDAALIIGEGNHRLIATKAVHTV